MSSEMAINDPKFYLIGENIMSTSSLALRLSQQDVNRVISDSTSLLESLGFSFEKQIASHLREQMASFQPIVELDKLKVVFVDDDGNCGWS